MVIGISNKMYTFLGIFVGFEYQIICRKDDKGFDEFLACGYHFNPIYVKIGNKMVYYKRKKNYFFNSRRKYSS